MKVRILLLCLITEAYTFPTQSSHIEESEACCGGDPDPQLVYQGHDRKHGLNVFVFEFPPVNEEHIPKKSGDGQANGSKKDKIESEKTLITNSAGVQQYEDVTPTTEEPKTVEWENILVGTNGNFENVILESKLSTNNINYSRGNSKNNSSSNNLVIEDFYEQVENSGNDTDLVFNTVIKILSGYPESSASANPYDILIADPNNEDIQTVNGYGDINLYYNTEGSAYNEIPLYNRSYEDTTRSYEDTTKPNISINFYPTDMESNNTVECSDSKCRNFSKDTKETLERVGKDTKTKNESGSSIKNNNSGNDKKSLKKTNAETKAVIPRKDTAQNQKNKGKKKQSLNGSGYRWKIFQHRSGRKRNPSPLNTSSQQSSDTSSESDSSSNQRFG